MTMYRSFLLALLLLPSPALAMEHYTNTLRDQSGKAIVGALVTVYPSGSGTVATIYGDNGVTTKPNPFMTGADGAYEFYANNGVYDIQFSHPRFVFDDSQTVRVGVYDPTTGGGGGGVTIDSGTSLPLTCTPASGPNALFLDTDSETLSFCKTTDTFGTVLESSIVTWPTLLATGAIPTNESSVLSIRGNPSHTTTGFNLYTHTDGSPRFEPVCSGVVNGCDIMVRLAPGKFWGLTSLDEVTTYLRVDQATGKITTATLNAEDAGVSITLYAKLCGGDLVGVDPATGTAGHIWNQSPLDTAPTAVAVVGTNRTTGYARFPDSDGNYGVQISCDLPAGFTGELNAIVWWTTSGTGNARIQFATKCYADDEADDAAFNTATPYTLAAGTAGRPQKSFVFNMDKTGCAENELMRVRVFRNRTEASDTLASGTFDVEKVELWARRTY